MKNTTKTNDNKRELKRGRYRRRHIYERKRKMKILYKKK